MKQWSYLKPTIAFPKSSSYFFQLDKQVEISFYLIAIALYHSRELADLKPSSLRTFSPNSLLVSKTLKSISLHFISSWLGQHKSLLEYVHSSTINHTASEVGNGHKLCKDIKNLDWFWESSELEQWLCITKTLNDCKRWKNITLFKSITMSCGSNNLCKIFLAFNLKYGMFYSLLLVPQNIIMDMNNVTNFNKCWRLWTKLHISKLHVTNSKMTLWSIYNPIQLSSMS